jgi:hypothetical protein
MSKAYKKGLKIIVFGVHHWPNREPTTAEKQHADEWYKRIKAFIPNTSKVIVTTGTYSNINHSPFPAEVEIVQNKIPYTDTYSREMNYFRNGFMTGIWNALINEDDWDILFHVQCRVLLGKSLTDEIAEFMNTRDKKVMAPRYTQKIGSSIEISIFAMKPFAVRKYATSGVRQSLNIYEAPDVNCEEEAIIMFSNTWFNPWQDVITTRQLDFFDDEPGSVANDASWVYSPFAILNANVIKSLPFISTNDKHIEHDALNLWKENHPCPMS